MTRPSYFTSRYSDSLKLLTIGWITQVANMASPISMPCLDPTWRNYSASIGKMAAKSSIWFGFRWKWESWLICNYPHRIKHLLKESYLELMKRSETSFTNTLQWQRLILSFHLSPSIGVEGPSTPPIPRLPVELNFLMDLIILISSLHLVRTP